MTPIKTTTAPPLIVFNPWVTWNEVDAGPEMKHSNSSRGIPGRYSDFVEVKTLLGEVSEASYGVYWSVDNSHYFWTNRAGQRVAGVRWWRPILATPTPSLSDVEAKMEKEKAS